MGTVQKNSRTFKLRRDAEKHSHRFVKLKSVEWRVQIAFQAGADWERRRWMKLRPFETPEDKADADRLRADRLRTRRKVKKFVELVQERCGPPSRPSKEIDMVHFIPPRR